MLTRKDFYATFGEMWGAILFHKIAAPLDEKGRLVVFTTAIDMGAQAYYEFVVLSAASQKHAYVH